MEEDERIVPSVYETNYRELMEYGAKLIIS